MIDAWNDTVTVWVSLERAQCACGFGRVGMGAAEVQSNPFPHFADTYILQLYYGDKTPFWRIIIQRNHGVPTVLIVGGCLCIGMYSVISKISCMEIPFFATGPHGLSDCRCYWSGCRLPKPAARGSLRVILVKRLNTGHSCSILSHPFNSTPHCPLVDRSALKKLPTTFYDA